MYGKKIEVDSPLGWIPKNYFQPCSVRPPPPRLPRTTPSIHSEGVPLQDVSSMEVEDLAVDIQASIDSNIFGNNVVPQFLSSIGPQWGLV